MDYYEFLRFHPNVKVRVLAEALQSLEDIGGPMDSEYIEVVSALKAEIELRLLRSMVLHMTGG